MENQVSSRAPKSLRQSPGAKLRYFEVAQDTLMRQFKLQIYKKLSIYFFKLLNTLKLRIHIKVS